MTIPDERYDATSLEVLSGLDPVKRRPGMYTDTTSPIHLVHEVVDNAVDEALAGHATSLAVTLHTDGSVAVRDDGRGMPIDVHPEEGIPGVELILTRLHAGGKFRTGAYRFSGGLHGVGISVVAALSKRMEVLVTREGADHRIELADGEVSAPLARVRTRAKRAHGTQVRFWPDPVYFDTTEVRAEALVENLAAKALLCPGLTVRLENEHDESTREWTHGGGPVARVAREGLLPREAITVRDEGDAEALDAALGWTGDDERSTTALSYANLIPTRHGGTHVNGLRTGVTNAVRRFAEARSLVPRGVRLVPEDVWGGLEYVLSIKLAEPSFAGQTKERLASREAAGYVAGVTSTVLGRWLDRHVGDGDRIVATCVERARVRLRAARAVERKRRTRGPALPGKLTDCTSRDPARSELFLVEGDSAGGSARQARDRETQAVMPLRGKILNTWEQSADRVLRSREVHDICVALDVDPGSSDLSRLRYHRVCILADADSDGAHIATLITGLFVRHLPAVVEAGRLYVARPPLYRIDCAGEVAYALDDREREALVHRLERRTRAGKAEVQRFKGLGEMNPAQLRETTMAPDTRRLLALEMTPKTTEEGIDLLLAKARAKDRRAWMTAHGDRTNDLDQ